MGPTHYMSNPLNNLGGERKLPPRKIQPLAEGHTVRKWKGTTTNQSSQSLYTHPMDGLLMSFPDY